MMTFRLAVIALLFANCAFAQEINLPALAQVTQTYLAANSVRPQDFGPITNNPVTDTVYIDAAFAVAQTQHKCVYFPGYQNYAYNGNGWSAAAPGNYACLVGEGYPLGGITLGDGKFLVDNSGANIWGGLYISGLYTVGGAGAIRDQYVGADTNSRKVVSRNYFNAYSGAAVSTESVDSPNWTFSDNIYVGLNSTTSVGIANCGLAGSIYIGREQFMQNRVHIKLGKGANDSVIGAGTYFIQIGTGTGRAAVWVVPADNPVNAGTGFVIRDTKFGNEGLDPSDYAVLYADEVAGSHCGERLPSAALSLGYISGHQIEAVHIAGGFASPTRPLVYSTTPNVTASVYRDIHVDGTSISNVLKFAAPSGADAGNVIGSVLFAPGSFNPSYTPTNGSGSTAVVSCPAGSLTSAHTVVDGLVTHC